MRNKNMGLIIEGLNEAKEKEFLSDFKKGEKIKLLGNSCFYVIKLAGKKKYKLEAIDPEDTDAISAEYFNPDKKKVFLSKNGDYVLEEVTDESIYKTNKKTNKKSNI